MARRAGDMSGVQEVVRALVKLEERREDARGVMRADALRMGARLSLPTLYRSGALGACRSHHKTADLRGTDRRAQRRRARREGGAGKRGCPVVGLCTALHLCTRVGRHECYTRRPASPAGGPPLSPAARGERATKKADRRTRQRRAEHARPAPCGMREPSRGLWPGCPSRRPAGKKRGVQCVRSKPGTHRACSVIRSGPYGNVGPSFKPRPPSTHSR